VPISDITGVVCVGNICYDIPVWPVDDFHWGTTTWVQELRSGIGGNGANTSFTLGKLGCPVKVFGIVGADAQGDELLGILSSASVNTTSVQRGKLPTNSTICVVNSSGERLFLHRLGCSVEMDESELHFSFEGTEAFSHFHMANPFTIPGVRKNAGRILADARAAGKTTSLDTGWDAIGRWMTDIGPALPHSDLMFLNDLEAKMLTGLDDVAQAAGRLRELGAADVLVKLGAGGSVLFTAGATYRTDAFPVRALDTTGAGDCYAGGFLAAIHHGASYEEALRVASAVGALNVSKLGAVTGILTWDETLAWMESQPAPAV
jgi:sugar/nucleoside kinase (ribokinase family)